METATIESLDDLRERLATASSFAVYAAGEFASVFVQCCCRWNCAERIEYCLVTKRDGTTPEHILGVPVEELGEADLAKETLIFVAVLSLNAQLAITAYLAVHGYHRVLLLSPKLFRAMNAELGEFSASTHDLLLKQFQCLRRVEQQNRKLRVAVDAMPLVVATHKKTFGPYKGGFRGRSVVLCGTGPTLARYAMNDHHIHIGLNSIIFKKDMASKLDFYFCQDLPNPSHVDAGDEEHLALVRELEKKHLDAIAALHCVRFIGQQLGEGWRWSPPYEESDWKGYHRYFNSDDEDYHFVADIRYAYLYGPHSVAFPALQFALFGQPERIYLVGCDGYVFQQKNYYDQAQSDYANAHDRMKTKEAELEKTNRSIIEQYEKLKEFVTFSYPSTEIVMVNPQRYRGIFRETVTDADGNIVEV